jgi:hypothetical protein
MTITPRHRQLRLGDGRYVAQTRDVITFLGEDKYRAGDRYEGGRRRMIYDVNVTELEKVCRVFVSAENIVYYEYRRLTQTSQHWGGGSGGRLGRCH